MNAQDNETPNPMPKKLPEKGIDHDAVLLQMRERKQADARWRDGRTFSLVYHAGDEHAAFLKEAFALFFSENALNPTAFRSLLQFETEVVSMVADLLSGDEHTAGTMTSGGTESLFLVLKTYRDRARAESPHIKQPEVVLPITAHPAFDKAAHCLDVKLVHVPVDADFRADMNAVRAACGPSTILLIGSAPAYPQGVIDPIAELAAIAQERKLGLHVDACLGGLLLPFLRDLGEAIPPFDFRVPGVTSISADLHKYGFTAKGASTVLYRDAALRQYQFFARSDWPGGLWGSTTLAGTRPGGPIAAAWATLMAIGRDGYLRMARQIMDTTRAFQEGIRAIPGMRVLGRPEMSVFAFTCDEPQGSIFGIADAMERRGWHVDRQARPDSMHLMITPAHTAILDEYLRDLRASLDEVRKNPEQMTKGSAAAYGLLASIPDRGMADGFILQHLTNLYK
jgi:glutamate/tyrosine decarboxylase-like PLP-dependent enzyme